jgi:hypothetical protein
MQVKNLFQLRVKVLTFVAVILPLAFLGRVMAADLSGPEVLYSGAGVFLVLVGIFLLVRFGTPSGDDSMGREGTRVSEDRGRSDRRPRPKKEPERKERVGGKERAAGKSEDWLEKQKESLKFQKESLGQVTDRDSRGEGSARQNGNVTVRPGPRRPRRRR